MENYRWIKRLTWDQHRVVTHIRHTDIGTILRIVGIISSINLLIPWEGKAQCPAINRRSTAIGDPNLALKAPEGFATILPSTVDAIRDRTGNAWWGLSGLSRRVGNCWGWCDSRREGHR